MRWIHGARVDLRALFRRRAVDDQLDADVRFHLEQATADYIAGGLAPDEARRAALRDFGNPGRVVEDIREMSMWIWWERLTEDLRFALRGFARSPLFTITAVVSLALAIGANTAIFTLVNAILVRSLPVSRPEQLVLVNPPREFAFPDYIALREQNRVFSDLVAASRARPYSVGREAGDAEQASIKLVSGNYFTGLGIGARIGRVFTIGEELDSVAVISHGYWTRRFGRSPGIAGQPIVIDGMPFTIAGVAPPEFSGEAAGESPDVWVSLAFQLPERRTNLGYSWLFLIGRLKPEIAPALASAELNAHVAAAPPTTFSTAVTERPIELVPGARGHSGLRNMFAMPLRALMIIVTLVLLVACTNLGSLLLTRGMSRQPEIAMRLALGASRRRVVRQLMTESLLLAFGGAALGLAVAIWISGTLLRLVSGIGRTIVLDLRPDQNVLLFTAGVSMASAVFFGLAPAIRTVRSAALIGLAGHGHRVLGRGRFWSLRDSFIVVQLALSLMLLATGAMFVRTIRNLQTQDLGFDAENVLLVQITPTRGYRPAAATVIPRLLERIEAIPSVESASVMLGGTLANSGGVYGLQIEGYTPQRPDDDRARADWIGPNYFRTSGIPLRAGRDFALSDTTGSQRVAIVNETMARYYFRDAAAVGRHFTFNDVQYEIVGVAKDAKYAELRESTPRVIYFDLLQGGGSLSSLEVRTAGVRAADIATAVRSAIGEVDPRLSAGEIRTLSSRIDQRLFREHLLADVSGVLGLLALLLVSIGIYGTLAYTVTRRAKEIGIRLALGSRRSRVIWIVLRATIVRLGIALLVGMAGVAAGGRIVAALLYGLGPTDPATIAVAAAMLVAVALLAAYVPAFRASRLDAAAILRE